MRMSESDQIKMSRTVPDRDKNKLTFFVYFLLNEKDVVYVGKSVDLKTRLKNHRKNKTFDDACWLEIPPEFVDESESHYIAKYTPVYNKVIGTWPDDDGLTTTTIGKLKSTPNAIKNAQTIIQSFKGIFYPGGAVDRQAISDRFNRDGDRGIEDAIWDAVNSSGLLRPISFGAFSNYIVLSRNGRKYIETLTEPKND